MFICNPDEGDVTFFSIEVLIVLKLFFISLPLGVAHSLKFKARF